MNTGWANLEKFDYKKKEQLPRPRAYAGLFSNGGHKGNKNISHSCSVLSHDTDIYFKGRKLVCKEAKPV